MANYDVASTIHQSSLVVIASYGVASTIHQSSLVLNGML
jgi:hypothetical protein